MSKDPFSGRAASATASATRVAQVTPTDDADLPGGLCRGLFVGDAGAVVLRDAHGETVELASAASQYHPLRVARVLATGTTAGRIIALY